VNLYPGRAAGVGGVNVEPYVHDAGVPPPSHVNPIFSEHALCDIKIVEIIAKQIVPICFGLSNDLSVCVCVCVCVCVEFCGFQRVDKFC